MGKQSSAEQEPLQLAAVTRSSPQAGDPVDVLMGDVDELRDELESLDPHSTGADDYDEPLLPPEFDLFECTPTAVRKVRAAKRDPTVTRIDVHRVQGGVRKGTVHRYRPEGVTYARLQSTLPPGRYDVVARQENNVFMGAKRITVTAQGALDDLSEADGDLETLGASRPRGRGNRSEDLLWLLAQRGLRGSEAQGSGSEMREATAAMMKMMTLQLEAQREDTAARLKMLEAETKAGKSSIGEQVALMKTMFDMVQKQTPRRSSGGTKVEDFVGLVQLGMHFQQMMAGKKEGAPPDPDWVEKLAPIVDSLGPGLVSLGAAILLGEDKAKPIIDLVEQQWKTRQAEAEAAASEAQSEADPATFDTTGESVE